MIDTFFYITPELQNLHQWSLPQWASGCHSPKVHLWQHCQWNQDHPDVLQTAPRGGVSRCWLYTGIQILALPFIFARSTPLSVDDFKTGQIFLNKVTNLRLSKTVWWYKRVKTNINQNYPIDVYSFFSFRILLEYFCTECSHLHVAD